jgi:hypothetical protein
MAALLREPELRKEMGSNGQRLVSGKFTRERIADQMCELYERVLKIHSRRIDLMSRYDKCGRMLKSLEKSLEQWKLNKT